MTISEIENFQGSMPGPLPEDVLKILEYASGFRDASFGYVDFTGNSNTFSFREIFPYGLPVAQRDGNFWIVDIAPDGCWGNVFFVSHDPAVALIQFQSFSDFVRSVAAKDSVLVDAQGFASQIWMGSSSYISVSDARGSPDLHISSFASELPDDFEIYDLRSNFIGGGFSWGRTGPEAECKRANSELIFALQKIMPRKGFLKKLFNR